MASTYVNNLRLNEMGTGDASGVWGSTLNTQLELIGEGLGYGTEGITTNADTHTSTIADGSTDPVRAMYVKYTGTLDSACTITIAPNTVNRMQFIENATSGSQNIIISQGSGANITIPAGDTKAVYLDGAGSGAAVVDAFASLNVVDLKVQDDLTVTDDLIVNGDIDLEGAIDVNGTANLDVVDIDGAVDMASTLGVTGIATFSGTVVGNATNFDIKQNTSDASDNRRTRIGGGGDVSHTRGAFIELTGNEHSDTGSLTLNAGDVSGGDIVFKTDNTTRVTIDDAGGMEITTADNADTLSLVSTDADANSGPNLRMYRNSGSPADSDAIALIDFEGRNDNSQDVVYAAIDTRIVDASDGTEDGRIEMATILAGTAGTSRILMDATETAFNDNSKDLDFRVESDNLTHALFVQGSDGNVGIGTSSLFGELSIDSNAAPATSGSMSTGLTIHNGSSGTAVNIGTNDSGGYGYMQSSYVNNAGVARGLQLITGASVVLTLDTSNDATFAGDVSLTGALSKGSGTFRIPHGLRENYDLCHSFVEGPQCDLIYRGKVDLVNGRATVSMDTKYGMTAGTFAWLTRDVQTFTSNETGWDAVKSSFSGDTITIECQNTSSTDTISWMVVAERDDPNIKASEITDADGKLLIERASKPGFWDSEEE